METKFNKGTEECLWSFRELLTVLYSNYLILITHYDRCRLVKHVVNIRDKLINIINVIVIIMCHVISTLQWDIYILFLVWRTSQREMESMRRGVSQLYQRYRRETSQHVSMSVCVGLVFIDLNYPCVIFSFYKTVHFSVM